MEIKYYKTQVDLADALKLRIELYWGLELEENLFISQMKTLVACNEDLLFKEGSYASIITQKLGKKRLVLMDKILGRVDEVNKDREMKYKGSIGFGKMK